jgi:hypothetical protein
MWEMTRAGEAIEAELSPQTETPPESDWAMYLRNSAKSVEEGYLLPRECRAIADALAAPSQPMAGEPVALLREALPCVEQHSTIKGGLAERIRAALAQHGDKP